MRKKVEESLAEVERRQTERIRSFMIHRTFSGDSAVRDITKLIVMTRSLLAQLPEGE